MTEQTKYTYSSIGKAFENKKLIEKHTDKQTEAIKDKIKKQVKDLDFTISWGAVTICEQIYIK